MTYFAKYRPSDESQNDLLYEYLLWGLLYEYFIHLFRY